VAGVVFVVALLAEGVISTGIPITQDDSAENVLGSLFLLAAGLLILDGGAMPRWLGWTAIVAGVLLFLQGFGLGGVINGPRCPSPASPPAALSPVPPWVYG
jgi:hypothetical protein